ncbi:MAG: 16S rRNA (cytosine(1402)-N(4))-methyltransferase RsmH [bacterium]
MHIPVLKNEVLEIIDPQPGKTYIDATVGEGGHLLGIIEKTGGQGRYLGIDLEKRNIEYLTKIIKERGLKGKISLENASFINIDKIAKKHNINEVDGILFDFGVCSWQIDESGRGFSFKRDEPLDMRFDSTTLEKTAKEILNQENEFEIARIIKEYGEEKYYRRIAKGIVEARKRKQINTTGELVDIIKRSIPDSCRNRAIHPATRTFQGLRIAVNGELQAIAKALIEAWELLDNDGILIAISFHSLEDRLVKDFFKVITQKGEGRVLTKKPITPLPEEILINRRSRSAKLRAIIKE